MVPLRDENPTYITPLVTYGLIALNVVVFFREISFSSEQLNLFFQGFAIVPGELSASFQNLPDFNNVAINQPIPELMTLVTSQFLHGGWGHLGGNMLFLYIFGNNVEEALGHKKFLIFYLGCGALAGLCQWIVAVQSPIPTLGASGAIAGVMGAYILKYPQARILTLLPLGIIWTTVRIPAVFFLGFWFAQQAFFGVTSLGMTGGGVAYWAHAGGFIFGAILGPLLGLFSDRSRRY